MKTCSLLSIALIASGTLLNGYTPAGHFGNLSALGNLGTLGQGGAMITQNGRRRTIRTIKNGKQVISLQQAAGGPTYFEITDAAGNKNYTVSGLRAVDKENSPKTMWFELNDRFNGTEMLF